MKFKLITGIFLSLLFLTGISPFAREDFIDIDDAEEWWNDGTACRAGIGWCSGNLDTVSEVANAMISTGMYYGPTSVLFTTQETPSTGSVPITEWDKTVGVSRQVVNSLASAPFKLRIGVGDRVDLSIVPGRDPSPPDCSDGVDNDSAGGTDLADADCVNGFDNSESTSGIQYQSSDTRCKHGTLSHLHLTDSLGRGDDNPASDFYNYGRCSWDRVPMCNSSSGSKANFWCRCCTNPPCSTTCDSSLNAADCGSDLGAACVVKDFYTDLATTCIPTIPISGNPTVGDPGYPYVSTSHDNFNEINAEFAGGVSMKVGMATDSICDGEAFNEGVGYASPNTIGGIPIEVCPNTNVSICDKIDCATRRPIYYASANIQEFEYPVSNYPTSYVTAEVTSYVGTSLTCCDIGNPGWDDSVIGKTVYVRYDASNWSSNTITGRTAGNVITFSGPWSNGNPAAGNSFGLGPPESKYVISGIAFDLRQSSCQSFKAAKLWNHMYEMELGDDTYPRFMLVTAKTGSWGWYDKVRYSSSDNDIYSRNSYWWEFGPWSYLDTLGANNIAGPFHPVYGPGEYENGLCGLYQKIKTQHTSGAASRFTDVKYGALDIATWRSKTNGGGLFCQTMLEDPDFVGSRSTYVNQNSAPVWK